MSMEEHFSGILRSSKMEISSDAYKAVGDIMRSLFQLKPDGTFERVPNYFGDDYSGRGVINIMPGTGTILHPSDTLVVYCIGGDNLNRRLDEMLIAVGAHGYSKVIFLTTKWDALAVAGANIQKLHAIDGLRKRNGATFCFVLVTAFGISEIPFG
jgi:hypothetical protein